MKDETARMVMRLHMIKDYDPYNKKILNDCYDHIQKLQEEVDRLCYHNNNLMNVIYQNQHELESVNEPTGE